MSRPTGKQNSLIQPKQELSIKYLHQPPTIQPNYGNQKRSLLPKSKVSRVLLYDNTTQDHMLGIRLAHINIEKERISRLINIQSRSFVMRQKTMHKHMKKLTQTGSRRAVGLPNINIPPPDKNEDKHAEINPHVSDLNLNAGDLKLPSIDGDKRRVIFKVKDTAGNTQVYHTVDENGGMFGEIIPLHSFYSKMTDDPRFQSLTDILVPKEQEDLI